MDHQKKNLLPNLSKHLTPSLSFTHVQGKPIVIGGVPSEGTYIFLYLMVISYMYIYGKNKLIII